MIQLVYPGVLLPGDPASGGTGDYQPFFLSPINDITIDNPVWFQVLTLSHGGVKMQHKQRLETQVLMLIMNHNGGIDIDIENEANINGGGKIVKISSCGDSMRRLGVLGARPVNM